MGSTLVSLSWWDWDEEKIRRSLPAIMSGELDKLLNRKEGYNDMKAKQIAAALLTGIFVSLFDNAKNACRERTEVI